MHAAQHRFRWTRSPHRPRWVALVTLVALLTAGCASSGPAGNGHPASSSAPPVISLTSPTAQVNPAAAVTLAVTGGPLVSVQMTNRANGKDVPGTMASDHRGWHSTGQLGYSSTYQLSATAQAPEGPATTRAFTVTTLSPAGQAETQLAPAPELVSATGFGVGQPLVVTFTHAVSDRAGVQAHLHVMSTPAQPGAWFWIDDTHVHYRPQQFWVPGTTIDLNAQLYGVNLGGGIYGADDHRASYHVHDSWIAKADGNSEKMAIFQNGHLVNTMPISMGKGSTPTHQGVHVISDKQQSVQMNSCSFGVCSGPQAYNVTEYWAERISNDGEFVHQNPDSVSAQGNSNVSHGCINLNQANAQWFFQHLGPGDVVEVDNSGGPNLPIWDTYGDWSLTWPQWQSGKVPNS